MSDTPSRSLNRTLTGIAMMLALGLTACSEGISPDTHTPPPTVASTIAGWENSCDVHDVAAIQEFTGIRELGNEPGEVDPGGGFSTDTAGCDIPTVRMPLWEYTDWSGEQKVNDSLSGSLYLRVDYYLDEETFAENYQNARDVWSEASSVDGRHIVDEQELTGDWDEGMIFLSNTDTSTNSSSADNAVIGKLRDDRWAVGFELSYNADPITWGDDRATEQVYPFTDEELFDWVAETYLPQVHAAVVAAAEAEI